MILYTNPFNKLPNSATLSTILNETSDIYRCPVTCISHPSPCLSSVSDVHYSNSKLQNGSYNLSIRFDEE